MRKLAVAMALASTALASPALAADDAWYVGVEGGVMIVEDLSLDIGAAPDAASMDHETGYDIGGFVGYDFGGFRAEVEVGYRQAESDGVNIAQGGIPGNAGANTAIFGRRNTNGQASALSFMLNGLFDFGKDDGIQAFAGGGVGVARVDMEGRVNANGPGVWNDSDTGFAWQLLAGIRAPLSDSWDVGLKYRYFNVPDISIVDPLGRALDTKLNSHSLLGSITRIWSQPTPKRRSPSARSCAASRLSGCRVASITTKSLPAPCILVKRNFIGRLSPALSTAKAHPQAGS